MSSYNRLGECFSLSYSSYPRNHGTATMVDLSVSELRNLFVYSGATVAC